MDVLQTDQRIERTRNSGAFPAQIHPTPPGWTIACLAASALATASDPPPSDRPAPHLAPIGHEQNFTIHEFHRGSGAAPVSDTCATGLESPQLHPSHIDSEIHLTWPTTAGTLYTVELSTDHLGWRPGPHLIGDGGIISYNLLDNFGPLEKSGLVRLGAYPDPLADPDGDGLDTLTEVTTTRTLPYSPDSDSDGLYDGYEAAQGTDPVTPDQPDAELPSPNTNLIVYRPH